MGTRPGGCGSADERIGNCFAHTRGSIVIQLVVVVLSSLPVILAVWFVPDFPIPGGDCFRSIALGHVRGYLARQLFPALVVLRRKGPAFYLTLLEGPADVIGLGMGGKRFGHKAKLDHGTYVG